MGKEVKRMKTLHPTVPSRKYPSRATQPLPAAKKKLSMKTAVQYTR